MPFASFRLLSINVVTVRLADSKRWFVFLGCFVCLRKTLWQSPKPFISWIGVTAACLFSLLFVAAHPFRFLFCCFPTETTTLEGGLLSWHFLDSYQKAALTSTRLLKTSNCEFDKGPPESFKRCPLIKLVTITRLHDSEEELLACIIPLLGSGRFYLLWSRVQRLIPG